MKGDNDDTESTRDSSIDSKSPFRPLASEDSLWNSHSSGCHLGDQDDDDNWRFFDQVPKRNRSVTVHSMASTATLTSNGSSHGNSLSISSNSNSNRSPMSDRRGSIGSHKSPRRSPRPGCLRKTFEKQELSDRAAEIASLPLTTATASGHAPEEDRGQGKKGRRFSGGDRPPKDGQGLYYQPSKASLHNTNLHKPAKKPQRIRARSKGPVLRRNSSGASQMKSQSLQPGRTTSRDTSSAVSKRSKSCDPHDGICGQSGITQKKSSRSSPRSRKKSSIKDSNASFHESWPQPQQKRNKKLEEQKQHHRQTEKIKRKKLTSKTKPSLSHKQKETKEGKGKGGNDVNDVITFFEDMATMKKTMKKENPTTRPGAHPGRTMTKSSSERCVPRSKSPASSSVGASFEHGAPNGPENPLLDPSNKHRQRRSSAPAKAIEAFQQYRNSIGVSEFEDFDEPAPPEPESPAPEKILLDVSELAALEIIRLGKDNSLKLDLFGLMKHLKRQQQKKNTAVSQN